MMKRERKQVTIYKVSKIFIKTLLLIMMAMAVSMFAPIGARAAVKHIAGAVKTSDIQDMGTTDTICLDGDTTLIVDEPLTIKDIYANNLNLLTITGNAGLTLNSSGIAIEVNDLSIVDCSLKATSDVSVLWARNTCIDNSNIIVNCCTLGIPGNAVAVDDLTIKNNSVVYISGGSGIGSTGKLSISGVGTCVSIEASNAATEAVNIRNGIYLSDGLVITEPAGGEIKKDGNNYYIYESNGTKAKKVTIKKPVPVAPTVNNTNSGQKEPSHTHSFSWVVTKSPTSTSDGEEAYMCSCGEIARTSILPAISAFEEETINKIKNAPANAVIEVETSLFNSFGIGVRDALAARPDVTLKVKFLSEGYRGQLLKVTIPTGRDRYALWDEKGWLGLCRAGSTLGYDK